MSDEPESTETPAAAAAARPRGCRGCGQAKTLFPSAPAEPAHRAQWTADLAVCLAILAAAGVAYLVLRPVLENRLPRLAVIWPAPADLAGLG